MIALHLDEGLSFEQVGARLHKSADATRMLYNRALQRLQTLLPAEQDRTGKGRWMPSLASDVSPVC